MSDWREEADERLQGFFSDDPMVLRQTVADVVEEARGDPELEDALLETLQQSIQEGSDETHGTAWIAVALGELRSRAAVGPLLEAIHSGDDMVLTAAIRALRRIGPPAFETLLEILDEGEVPEETFTAAARVFEAAPLHDDPELQESIEGALRRQLLADVSSSESRRKMESAALSLARLGAPAVREPIERLLETVFDGVNAYLQEALEILEEHPEGLPCDLNESWVEEFRWALGDDLPGGELEPDEEFVRDDVDNS